LLGGTYGVGTALLRDVICRLIWVMPLVGIIDCLMPLGEERQTLRDRMVHTRVMQEPRSAHAAGHSPARPWQPSRSGWPAHPTPAAPLHRRLHGCRKHRGAMRVPFDYIRQRLDYAEYREADQAGDASDWSPRAKRVIGDAMTNCA
jgi:hypothetical protein